MVQLDTARGGMRRDKETGDIERIAREGGRENEREREGERERERERERIERKR